MTRPLDRHLDREELERLVSGAVDSSRVPLDDAQLHVDSCPDCHRKVSMHRFVQSEISRRQEPSDVPLGPDCREQIDWFEVAAGLLPAERSTELMKHATQCRHCGPLLRQAAEVLSSESTPEEQELIAALDSSRSSWQSAMAESLKATVTPAQSPARWRVWLAPPRLAFALAIIMAVAAVGWFAGRGSRASSVNALLAQAYSERRMIEVRIPGAKYAPVRVQRGVGGSNLEKPSSLLKAEALISENLEKHPEDPAWLQAKARADLLDGNFESAIQSLRRALEVDPNSLSLQTDLGSAYFERAETTSQAVDYGNAIDSLGRVLSKSPDDPIALFNRALACERMFLYTQAIDDWQHYLRVDPRGEWSAEARSHLVALQEKLKEHARQQTEPLLTPLQIAAGAGDAATLEKIEAKSEGYIDVAFEQWFPQMISNGADATATQAKSALETLASVLAAHHADPWFDNLLAEQLPNLDAITALGESIRLNRASEFVRAEQMAAQAEKHIASPLWLDLARLERLTAVNREFNGECARLSQTMVGPKDARYIWFNTRLSLEEASCQGSLGNVGAGRRASLSAVRTAQSGHYPYLYLRAIGSVAETDPDTSRSLDLDVAGLRTFWESSTNSSRAYQFLEAMAIIAENAHKWFWAVPLNKEAVVMVGSAARPKTEATARLHLGQVEYETGDARDAGTEWQNARDTLGTIPSDQDVQAIVAELDLDLAKADLADGRINGARDHLQEAAPKFTQPGLGGLYIEYLSTLGSVLEHSGSYDDSEKIWRQAMVETERQAASLGSVFDRLRLREKCSSCGRALLRLRLLAGDQDGAWELWQRFLDYGSPREKSGTPLSLVDDLGLSADTALYTFVHLDDSFVVWLRTSQGSNFYRLEVPRQEFQDVARRFAARCADRESRVASLQSDGKQLYGWLLRPVADRIAQTKILIIQADPDLPYELPFEAMVDDQGEYVASHFAVAYVKSLRSLLRPALDFTKLFHEHAVVVDASNLGPQSGYSPLTEAAREAEEVASLFEERRFLRAPSFTSDEFSSALTNASVLHFAGHARRDGGQTGLMIWDAANSEVLALDPEEFVPRIKHLELAVLSACSTASSPQERDSSSLGIAEGFSLAGSRVVGNKWAVDSSASRIFVEHLYQALSSNLPLPLAVNRAQSLLRRQKGFAHPFFWSAASLWL